MGGQDVEAVSKKADEVPWCAHFCCCSHHRRYEMPDVPPGRGTRPRPVDDGTYEMPDAPVVMLGEAGHDQATSA